jgi:hypothetical protein
MPAINAIGRQVGEDRYVLVYPDGKEWQAAAVVARWAVRRDLNFGASDWAGMTKAIMETAMVEKSKERRAWEESQ